MRFNQAVKLFLQEQEKFSYSKILPRDQQHEAAIQAIYANGAPQHLITAEMVNGFNTHAALVIKDNMIVSFVCPTEYLNPAGTKELVGSFGDEIDKPTPASIAANLPSDYVGVLVTRRDAAKFNLRTEPTIDPQTVELTAPNPEATNNTNDAPEANNVPNLFWQDITEEDQAPILAYLPRILFVPKGVQHPTDVPIAADTPFDAASCPDDFTRMWLNAMRHQCKHHDGRSILSKGPMYPNNELWTSIPEENRPTNLTLSTGIDITENHSMLNYGTTPFRFVLQKIKTLDQALFTAVYQHYAKDIDARINNGNGNHGDGNATNGNQLTQEALTNAFQAAQAAAGTNTNHVKTSSEVNADKRAADIVRRYEIFGVSIKTDDNGVQSVEKGNLQPDFKQFLESSKADTRDVRDAFTTQVSTLKAARTALSTHVQLTGAAFDTTLVKFLQQFKWMTTPPTQSPDTIRTELTIYNFLTPTRTQDYQDRISGHDEIDAQLQLGEDPSRIKKRSTDLYIDGQQYLPHNVYQTASHFHCLLRMMYKNADTSLLWSLFQRFTESMMTEAGTTWCETYKNDPAVFANMHADMQTIVANLARLGNHVSLRRALEEGAPLPVAIFASVEGPTTDILRELRSLMTRCEKGRYGVFPVCIRVFKLPQRVAQLTGGTKRATNDGSTTPTKRNKTSNNNNDNSPTSVITNGNNQGNQQRNQANRNGNNNGNNNGNQFNNNNNNNNEPRNYTDPNAPLYYGGFLKYDQRASNGQLLRLPNGFTIRRNPRSTTDLSRGHICINYAMVGRACRNGNNCRHIHLQNYRDVPEESQGRLTEWVNGTANLEWAPGHGPTTGTRN